MAKLQSTFTNMVLSLTAITLIAATALACVYLLTKAQIEQQKRDAENSARVAVLCGHEDGVAIETQADGFGGVIRLMVGFDSEGHILGYEVLEHQETPGLGDKATWWFKSSDKPGQNIIGRKATGQMKVSKDGGDVDAITAATISSRAFLSAINSAYAEFLKLKGEQVQAWTGASTMMTDSVAVDSVKQVTKQETEVKDE